MVPKRFISQRGLFPFWDFSRKSFTVGASSYAQKPMEIWVLRCSQNENRIPRRSPLAVTLTTSTRRSAAELPWARYLLLWPARHRDKTRNPSNPERRLSPMLSSKLRSGEVEELKRALHARRSFRSLPGKKPPIPRARSMGPHFCITDIHGD